MERKNYYINLISLILILILIASFIFKVDPARIFFNKYSFIAKALLKENIELKSNLDERILKKEVIKIRKMKDQILILGSSRVMLIGNKNFIDKKSFNLGVSGAGLEDQLGLLNIYLEKFGYPDEVLLGIDPWVFNFNSDLRWKSIENEYLKFKKKILNIQNIEYVPSIDFNNYQKYLKLLEYMYLKDSIEHFKKNNLKKEEFYISILDKEIYQAKGNVYLKNDMKLVYSKDYRSKNNGSNWRSNFGYQLKDYNELDEGLKSEFVSTLVFLKSKSVNIKIFLSPYNPALIEAQEKENPKYNRMLQNTEAFVLNEAQKLGIEVIGSYFSKNIKINDFYDGIHLREEKLNEIFSIVTND